MTCFGTTTHTQAETQESTTWSSASMWYKATTPVADDKTDIFYITSTEVIRDTLSDGRESFLATLTPNDLAAMTEEDAYAEKHFSKGDYNFFCPYYHQFTFGAVTNPNAPYDSLYAAVTREMCEAFDYYMSHHNNGRRFAIIGFSQGAMLALELLKHMTDEQYSRLIAAYAIGYRISQKELDASKHIVPANDEQTPRVTVSFNSTLSQKGIWGSVAEGAVTSINPVNWRTDSTPATFTYNGHKHTVSLNTSDYMLYVNTDKTTAKTYRQWNDNPAFRSANVNPDCLHHYDLLFYTDFIHDNIAKRSSALKDVAKPAVGLGQLRDKIDSLDNQLVEILAERMNVCREVGIYKIKHGMPVLQQGRFDAILEKRSQQGEEKGMSAEFMKKVFTDIHDESCRQQEELMK